MNCTLCPRMCKADRTQSSGFCHVGNVSYVARAALHMWEEPYISGTHGSGTIFFCGCNLRCFFCQNHSISSCESIGGAKPVTAQELSHIMLALERSHAHNINFVTPTPHIPLIKEAVILARKEGLSIPTVFNTNSYVNTDTLKMLEGIADIYMPDFKYASEAMAKFISGAADYPQAALAAIKEMYRQCGNIITDENGIAQKGVAIRHLVLPGNISETRNVLDIIALNFPKNIHISLMSQYFPAYKAKEVPPFDRKLLKREYARAVDYAYSLGFTNIYTQELTSASEAYVPEWGEFSAD